MRRDAAGIAHVGLDGSWLRFNQAVVDLLGYPRETLQRLTFQDITHPEDLDLDVQRVSDVLEGKIHRYSIQKRYLHAEGHFVWASLTVSLVHDEDGSPLHFISVLQGIGEEKRLEFELSELNASLERRVQNRTVQLELSNRALEQFAYVAAHDLQEPLRTIASYLSLLERRHGDDLKPEAKEFLDIAVDGAVRMRALVSGVLEYSCLHSKPDLSPGIELSSVIQDALDMVRERIADTGATISVDATHALTGNRQQLIQLVQNLLTNAIRYRGDRKPDVSLTTRQISGDAIALEVQDNGIGIASNHQHEVFQLFRRLHPKGPKSGTGLGLAICKRIAENHSGRIELESAEGKGSLFRVVFTDPQQAVQ